jgi:drug/metabolite transporter (DMT)-like permease
VSRPVYLALVLLFCLTWSSAFPLAKIAMTVSPPLLFLGARFTVASILLLGWAWARGELRGKVPWLTLLALGLLNQGGYQGFAWLGMRSVSGGLATIIASLNPILVATVAIPLLGEAMTRRKLAGLLLGFAGAAFVVRNRIVLVGEDPYGVALLVLALISMTIGTLAFKWAAPRASLATAVGVQQLGAGCAILVAAAFRESPADIVWNTTLVVTYLWALVVVSIGALMLWFLLLRRGTASEASSLHFLMPPLGLLMSWAALGEPLQPLDLLGVVPVALGIRLATTQARAPI